MILLRIASGISTTLLLSLYETRTDIPPSGALQQGMIYIIMRTIVHSTAGAVKLTDLQEKKESCTSVTIEIYQIINII